MTVCAVDIGGTFTKAGAVDLHGAVRRFSRIPTAGPWEAFLARVLDQIRAIRANDPGIASIGVSVAGFLNPAHSMMIYNPNLPWLESRPLQAALQDALQLPVHLEVDSNAAALGEYRFGDGAGVARFLCLTIGTGIGGGFLVDGQPVRFTGECLGDVGHIIVEPDGARCSCGGRGCAEAVASAPAILTACGLAGVTLEQLAALPQADALFQDAGAKIGLLAASLASIFFPDRIALGGGVPDASTSVLAAAREAFQTSCSDSARALATLVKAKLGSHASLIGAATH